MTTKKYLSTVSRNLHSEDQSFDSVVFQAGFPILDSELNLSQSKPIDRVRVPSGIVDTYPPKNRGESDFITTSTPNVFGLKAFSINLYGRQLLVSGANNTNLANPSVNYIELPDPSTPLGAPPDITRTDFVFLEVWKAHVTPSSPSRYTFAIDPNNNVAGLEIEIDASAHTGATGQVGGSYTLVEGVDFQQGGHNIQTAENIATAINTLYNFPNLVWGTEIIVKADNRGIDKVFITISDQGQTTITPNNAAAFTLESSAVGTVGEHTPYPFYLWPNGNTQADSSNWFNDEITDFDLGSNSTSRVQYQYRFRVFSADFAEGQVADGIDPKSTFFGLDDQRIGAQGGRNVVLGAYPFRRPDPNLPFLFPYEDSGVFIAGAGDPTSANDLATADGFVYAFPICYVFRRNEGVFDPLNGANNGLLSTHAGTVNSAITNGSNINIPAGVSDRPDGLFSDLIADVDILDLRRKVFIDGVDYNSELTYQFQSLLDGSNRTWAMNASDLGTIGSGSGGNSTDPLVCDQFGRTGLFGGTPATGRGNLIRDLDHVCNRLSSAPVICRLVLEIDENSTQYGGAVTVNTNNSATHDTDSWIAGDEIHINLDLLDISTGLDWANPSAVNPIVLQDALNAGTVKGSVIDITEIYHNVYIEAFTSSQDAVLNRVQGLGTNRVSIKLEEDPRNCIKQLVQFFTFGSISLVPTALALPQHDLANKIYVVLAVEYSGGSGLSATPQGSLSSDGQIYPSIYSTDNPVVVEDVAEIPDMLLTTSPQGFFREGVRELALEYIPGNGGANDPSEVDIVDRGYHHMMIPVWPASTTEIRLPFKVHYQDSNNAQVSYEPLVVDNLGNQVPLDLTNSTLGETNTVLKFAQIQPITAYHVYIYRREALPNYGANGLRISAYYRRVAPQTCSAGYGANLASQSVTVRILSTNSKVSVLQFGHGSSQVGYPYVSPTDQIGVSPNIGFDESTMRGSLNVDLNGFSVGTGYVELPSVLPLDLTNDLTIGGPNNSPLVDDEGRLVYPMVGEGYLPNSFAQPLSSYVLHKNMVSFLAKVVDQTKNPVTNKDVFSKGDVVLVVLSRVTLDEQNKVTISPNDPSSVICIYRTKGLILTAGE